MTNLEQLAPGCTCQLCTPECHMRILLACCGACMENITKNPPPRTHQ